MKTNQTKPISTLGAMRIKSASAFTLVMGLSVAGFGQSFRNLDFEQATLVPVSGGGSGIVLTTSS